MERLFLASLVLGLVLLFPARAQAQSYAVDQGSILIDGDAALRSSGNGEGDRATNISVNPSAQLFVLPGLALGGQAFVSRTSFDDDAFTSYGVGPAASYYFGDALSTLFPFVSGSFFIAGDSRSDDTATALRLSGGGTYMLARNIGLTGEAYYLVQDLGEDDNFNEYGLAFGISAFLF